MPDIGWQLFKPGNPVDSEGHRKDGEARHKQGHGNESGNVTGKCSHDQLLFIPYVYYVCSIFVLLSIVFMAIFRDRCSPAIPRPTAPAQGRAACQTPWRRSATNKKARALAPGLSIFALLTAA
ncbi:MAG: hypothetical protein H6887_00360 [Hoeflea sp.]|nr:hypothetical protein [Hoeflea sp.]